MKVLLGITGSIAAYKTIELAKLLQANHCDVTLVLTKNAENFVPVQTLQTLFPQKVFRHDAELDNQDQMLHITLAKAADIILIAPASANFIAKLSQGLADCLLSTLCLATESPILIAPAMNTVMWHNKIVQRNVETLLNAGIQMIGPAYGDQACGDVGLGRMSERTEIVHYCLRAGTSQNLRDKTVVITLGPTQEKIDPVRFLSNHSSGKMGYALALSAFYMGAKVIIISGPTSIQYPPFFEVVDVESADDMLRASLLHAESADIFIGCAAVADYKVKDYKSIKIKKNSQNPNLNLTLELIENPDILKTVKATFPSLFCVGFAAETNDVESYGRNKLMSKNLDMIAINDVSNGNVFGQDYNELQVICRNKITHHIPRNTKSSVALSLMKLIAQTFSAQLHCHNV